MDVFDEAVAKGLMTSKRAIGCLVAVRREIAQSSAASVKDGMRAAGAGLRVLQWLRASGKERDLSFMAHPDLVNLLLPFMVAEGLDELAWAWLSRLMAGEGPTTVKNMPASAFLLDSLVSARSIGVGNLDEAYASILRGEEMLQPDSPEFVSTLLVAWRRLAWQSTVEAWKRSSPSEKLFESYVAIGDHLQKPMRIERAHLDLHHPTKPSHTLAVQYLLNESFWQRLLPKAESESTEAGTGRTKPHQSTGFVVRLMSLGLDTVQHLTQRGQSEEAQWILDLLRIHLGPYFANGHSRNATKLALG
jgi:hypothetical protein